MAKVVGPLHSVDATGSFGSLTYYHGIGGQTVRIKYPPCDPKSFAQTRWRRRNFAWINNSWTALSKKNVDLWNDFASSFPRKSGSIRSTALGGKDWFRRLCLNLQIIQGPILTHPPDTPSPDYFPELDIVWTSSGASLSWSPALQPGQGIVVRQLRNLMGTSLYSRKSPISHVFKLPTTSPQLLTPPSGSSGGPGTLPAIYPGSYIQFWVYSIDGWGRSTPWLSFHILTS